MSATTPAAPQRNRKSLLHKLSRVGIVATTAAVLGTTAIATAPLASAAPAYSASNVTAAVKGSSVTVSANVRSSETVNASMIGICARTASGSNIDFAFDSGQLTKSGRTVSKTKTLAKGTYSYWPCVKVGNQWSDVGAKQTFRVTGIELGDATKNSASAPNTNGGTTGTAMPVGDQPGWKQVFADDFTAGDVAQGGFPGVYKNKWMSYDGFADTYRTGTYNQDIISVSGGVMDINLQSMNGRPQVAAPVPMVAGKWGGQKYGKFSVRFRADALPGYKTAWLLWPDSDNWNQGEIDWPEGDLTGNMWGFNHCIGNPSQNCGWTDSKKTFTDWHIATVEWTPSAVKLIMDGQVMLNQTTDVPQNPMHWVLQTETNGKPNTSVSGKVQIDWATIYTYNP
ncbi:glycoside hydrolase family 16 protein [Nakamurella leprariae]|uniref:Glycoside hydrolase family 16 protein n=1 Tax=Nakamurella leprariae TaxID=2803911 RepID=A0A938YE31_9ACTN|nr:glycoside hydrolase family 16 protein [Nakamurella leprariae]MBM9467871.1 glycoside hydrolase family 16 protein [Nakamurella leprariae]